MRHNIASIYNVTSQCKNNISHTNNTTKQIIHELIRHHPFFCKLYYITTYYYI